MKIRIEYDSETMHLRANEDAESLTELIEGCVHVVGCMALLVRESYGEQGMEAMLQSIRNMDDAGGYTLLGMIEDGAEDEEKDAGDASVDRDSDDGRG